MNPNTITTGPRKLVMIDSGVYPYAEIDLEESVHLAGPNNSGKTTLLNALQFLYIDNITTMHFGSHDFQRKTKPFYFKPHGRSTILLEADTKWGTRTVGFHGLGSIAGCDWQRFGYNGPYDKDDWIAPENGQPRTWEDVKARLASRGYVELTQVQLRNALRGVGGERNSFRLELVPGGGNYDTFIEIFRQLLTLRKSKPDDLKNLLISTVEHELESGEVRRRGIVSLAEVVGEEYIKANQTKAKYDRVLGVERTAQNLYADGCHLREYRDTLPGLLEQVLREAQSRAAMLTRQITDAETTAEDAEESVTVWSQRRRDLDQSKKQNDRELGGIQTRLDMRRLSAERLAEEPKAIKESKLASLREDESEVLRDLALHEPGTDSSVTLRSKVENLKRERASCLSMAERLRTQGVKLTKTKLMAILEEYPEEERGPLLKLINPTLLLLPEGPGGLNVTSPAQVGQLITAIANASRTGRFVAQGLEIDLGALPSPDVVVEDPLARERQIEGYEGKAQRLEADISRLEQQASETHVRERLTARRQDLRKQIQDLERDLIQIATWEQEGLEIPALEVDAARLEAAGRKMDEDRENAITAHEEAKHSVGVYKGQVATLRNRLEAVRTRAIRDKEQIAFVLGIEIVDVSEAELLVHMEDETFDVLLERIENDWRDVAALQQAIARRLDEVDAALGGMLAGDQDQKLVQLQELVESLPDQKAMLDATWQHIAVTAKTSFSMMLRDYERVEERAHRLNRKMTDFAVSNLSNVQLRLVENKARTDVLRRFTAENDLFNDHDLAGKAKEQVAKWIERNEEFRLNDFFRVELDVVKDGEKETYFSLDAESTGTSVTLKVVLLAHLLRDLYRNRNESQLLIFVDEVDTLDDANQETIRACAKSLGFTLIMASPNPANARRLYFLRPEGKVTYIYPEESLEVDFLETMPLPTTDAETANVTT